MANQIRSNHPKPGRYTVRHHHLSEGESFSKLTIEEQLALIDDLQNNPTVKNTEYKGLSVNPVSTKQDIQKAYEEGKNLKLNVNSFETKEALSATNEQLTEDGKELDEVVENLTDRLMKGEIDRDALVDM